MGFKIGKGEFIFRPLVVDDVEEWGATVRAEVVAVGEGGGGEVGG